MTVEKIPILEKEISHMNEKIDTIYEEFKEHRTEMKQYFEKLESKFAGKWTEKIIIFIGGAVGTIIIGAIMALVIKWNT